MSGSRPRRLAPLVAAPVAVVLVAFILVLATRLSSQDRAAPSPLNGRVAPELVGTTLDGATFDLDAWRGRWVVVNFFSTSCPPCLAEHPEFVDFAARHEQDERRLVAVLFNEPDPDPARRFFADNNGTWPVVDDPGGELAVSYAVASVPETVLVAPSGIVVGKITGATTADALDRIIDDLSGVG